MYRSGARIYSNSVRVKCTYSCVCSFIKPSSRVSYIVFLPLIWGFQLSVIPYIPDNRESTVVARGVKCMKILWSALGNQRASDWIKLIWSVRKWVVIRCLTLNVL
jgi:hypothetical protein